MVRCNTEDAQHLVEHLAMPTGHGHRGLGLIRARLRFVDVQVHLDSLRAGAEDEYLLLLAQITLQK